MPKDTQPLAKDDWERARVVDEDLEYLIETWHPSLDEASLRRDSPMLRRLLVDGEYSRAWRDVGLSGEPYISAPMFEAGLGETTREYVQFATSAPGVTVANSLLAGGKVQMGVLQKVAVGSAMAVVPGYGQQFGLAIPPEVVTKAESTDRVVSEHLKPGRRHVVGLPVSKFLQSTFALILGTEVSRREVIQYVAHKLGGAHFDPGRSRKGDASLELLDQLAKTRLELAGQRPINAVYIELLSIAEWLGESGDASRFRTVFKKTRQPEQSARQSP